MTSIDDHYGPDLGEWLADAARGPKVIASFCEHAIRELATSNTLGDDFLVYFTEVVRQRSADAGAIIHRYSESPIERVFLTSLVLLFLKSDPLAFRFTPPCGDAPRQIRDAKKDHLRVLEWVKAFKSNPPGTDFAAWLDELEKAADLPIPNREDLKTEAILALVGFFKAYHFTPQAGFPPASPSGRRSRVDLLVWYPEHPGPGLIVECDGYAFHYTKAAFLSDRQRDRRLLRQGYQVVRYAGTEIANRPAETASDLYDHLVQSADRT